MALKNVKNVSKKKWVDAGKYGMISTVGCF